jgi:hypothetical protein
MPRSVSLLLLLTCWISAQTSAPSAAPASQVEGIDEAVNQLAKITGLDPVRKVESSTITRAGVRRFLEERLKEEMKPEDIRLEELSLKRFGLVPDSFDLKSATVDLITEQAAAFYDYRKKKLFILEGDEPKIEGADSGKSQQQMIVVHELAHALADQHFNLGKFIRKGRNDDAATARMAVMEGQATWLMLESMVQGMHQSMRDMPAAVELMGAGASEAMASQYPVLAKVPLYMRASLIFPYNQGLKFQHAVLQKLGNEAFSQVFTQPPVSTQQILHPEKYFAKVEPVHVELPVLPNPRHWKTILDATVGEFDHSILLEQYLTKEEAGAIAPHWRGGRLALAENKAGKNVALLYASEWDDAASARRMFAAYRQVLKGKWKQLKVTSESATSFSGTGDVGPFIVTLNGTHLTSLEGAESPGSQVN